MSRVIAFVDESANTRVVVKSAESLAVLLGAELDVIHVSESKDPEIGLSPEATDHDSMVAHRVILGEPVPTMLQEIDAGNASFAVIGQRSVLSKPEAAGRVAIAMLQEASVPLLVIPPNTAPFPSRSPRLLLPLDGTNETSTAMKPVTQLFIEAGADILTLHVFDSTSVPRFIESSQDLQVLAQEFQTRHAPAHEGRCELRIGDPAAEIMDVAAVNGSEGILLAWRQDLSPGHARVVTQLLHGGDRPLIFAPIGRQG